MKEVEGKSYIVTGAGSGIGRETALMLGRFGALVTAADVSAAAVKATADEIQSGGGKAVGVPADIADEAQVKQMVDTAVSAFGGLDGAANCAGIGGSHQPIGELALEDWNKVVAINLTGAFLCVKYQAAAIIAAGRPGSIVVISSAAAWKAYPALSAYAAAKAGLGGLVRSAAADLGGNEIRVNAILPGRVETAMLQSYGTASPDAAERTIAQQLLKRSGQPAQLGAAIIWLLSDQSSFVTGTEIPVDGGLTVG